MEHDFTDMFIPARINCRQLLDTQKTISRIIKSVGRFGIARRFKSLKLPIQRKQRLGRPDVREGSKAYILHSK